MIDEDVLTKIVDQHLAEARRDYVGLWQIFFSVSRIASSPDRHHKKTLTLRVVEQMIQRGAIAVDLIPSGSYLQWGERDASKVTDRIDREWKLLGRDPSINDLAWFFYPMAGKRDENSDN